MARLPNQATQPDLTEIIDTINQNYGRDISVYETSFLGKVISHRREETNSRTPREYSDFLIAHSEEASLFINSLNNNHSLFFRNMLSFSLLEKLVLPAILKASQKSKSPQVRIWSAGCAAGEEAFSVAILLAESEAELHPKTAAYIFATDLSEAKLAEAKIGLYDYEHLKNVKLEYVEKYFSPTGTAFVIKYPIKSRVSFSYYDLLDKNSLCPPESIFGDFNLILCCNVLYYYKADIRRLILNKLSVCLADGGFLMTSEAERSFVAEMSGFKAVTSFAPIFQKK